MNAELHHLTGAYAVDALDAAEREAFEAHLDACVDCQREVSEFRETLALRAEAEPVAPPASVRDRVLADAASSRQLPPQLPDVVVDLAERRRMGDNRRRLLTAAAAAVVLFVGAIGALSLRSDGDPRDAVLAAPDAVFTDLAVNADGADGMVRVVWSADLDEAVVIASGLEPVGDDQIYELWFLLEDGGVAPAGLFRPEAGSVEAVLDLDDIDGIGWGVSIEPAEGSEQPTGDVLFVGTTA